MVISGWGEIDEEKWMKTGELDMKRSWGEGDGEGSYSMGRMEVVEKCLIKGNWVLVGICM